MAKAVATTLQQVDDLYLKVAGREAQGGELDEQAFSINDKVEMIGAMLDDLQEKVDSFWQVLRVYFSNGH